ncbi:hypothetical protein [Wolbachia sp. wLmal]
MYNQEYLSQVEETIKKLQSGERVVSIAYGDHRPDAKQEKRG